MSSTSMLPLETIETIIDILAADDEDSPSIKKCALVSHTFLPLARKHIFAFISLNDVMLPASAFSGHPAPSFQRLLSTTPEIADHIRFLSYRVVDEDLKSSTFANVLKQITKLQSLTVWSNDRRKKFKWNDNPLRPALLHLLHLPTLIHLKLFSIDNFVVFDLVPCVGLKDLNISHVTAGDAVDIGLPPTTPVPDKPVRLSTFSAGVRSTAVTKQLLTTLRPDGKALIEFAGLTKLTVQFGRPDSVEVARELFKHCVQLTSVSIDVLDPALTMAGFAELVLPSLSTLKDVRLEMVIGEESPNDDPLSGIASELEELNNENIIETLTIDVHVVSDEACKTGDEWGILDKVLTSRGWNFLRRLSLSITISRYDTNNEELEQALKKLPETQFPRISSSKTVEFEFKVTNLLV